MPEIIEKINNLKPVKNHQKLMSTVLSEKDQEFLTKIGNKI